MRGSESGSVCGDGADGGGENDVMSGDGVCACGHCCHAGSLSGEVVCVFDCLFHLKDLLLQLLHDRVRILGQAEKVVERL